MTANRHGRRRDSGGDADRRGHSLQHRTDSRTGEGGSRERPTGHGEVGDRQTSAAQAFGSAPQGNAQRRGTPERAHGGRMSAPTYQSFGNPRTGSQRSTDSDLGIAGTTGGQFGDLHGQRPSEAQRQGYHADDREAGRSARDVRFGSRRGAGHGSRRREDPRTREN